MNDEFKNRVDYIIKQYATKNAIAYMRDSGVDGRYTFSDVRDFFQKIHRKCLRMGLQHGDRVAIISPHSPYAVLFGLALSYFGATIVLIDASLPEDEIARLLEYSDVRACFTTEHIYQSIFKENQMLPFFALDKGLDITLLSPVLELRKTMVQTEADVIVILYSSGTTGQMKGIKVTYESVLKARTVFARLSGLQDYMSYLLVLPFNHIAGFTGAMTYFLTGCTLGFIENVNATKLQKGLLKFQPHYFAMVPKVYEVMEQKIRAGIHEKGKAIECGIMLLMGISGLLRKHFGINIGRHLFKDITKEVFGENVFGIGTGASPCKAETAAFFLNLGLEWANLYATTETSVPIVATGIRDIYPVDTVGNVYHNPEIKVKIFNPDNYGIGEIVVKSELIMKGYFKRDDLTEKAFVDDYFRTGDYGYIDKKGYLHIDGRIKESIVLKNGKKVSPLDIDDYYMTRLPNCHLASRGIQNEEEKYDEIHVFVEAKEYSEEQKQHLSEELIEQSKKAPEMYKISKIHFVNVIPKNSVGKVKRYCLEPLHEEVQETKNYNEYEQLSDEEQLIHIISRHSNQNAEIITQESRLVEDLGMDSLDLFEMVCDIETIFHVNLSERLSEMVTVNKLSNQIFNKENTEIEKYYGAKSKHELKRLKRYLFYAKHLYKLEIEGLENIPNDKSYLICANHQSYFDPLWILAAMRKHIDLNTIHCLAAKHTMEGKFSKKMFDSLGGIPVDREGNTIPAMYNAKKALDLGGVLIIFPEGKRSRDGSMLPFQHGASQLAIDTCKKILPIRIEGAFDAFSRWEKYPKFLNWKKLGRYKIQIKFLKPLNPIETDAETLTTELKNVISDAIMNKKEQ